ncbi:hypothetical protein VB264_01505 [Arcicella aquatica]|uniref:Pentapeptide repeat-containing protein n=1 Tax=Arcicella aquatica TaxID=217141 RepID=A0ABU5QHA4_9BACT|nr:hypothetical protein [Arcicella aquatica]MEA5256437.1 hypothetical protein [Arcicella aquatica]
MPSPEITRTTIMQASLFCKIIQAKKGEEQIWKNWFSSNGEIKLNNIVINQAIKLDTEYEYTYPIILTNCSITSLTLNRGSFNSYVKFDTSQISHIRINSDTIFYNQLFITNCEIGNLFLDGSYKDEVYIFSNRFKNIFETRDPTFWDKIIFNNNTFENSIRFWGGVFKREFFLYDSMFKGDVSFQNTCFEKGLKIGENNIFESELNFQSGRYESLLIFGGQFKEVDINGGVFGRLSFSDNMKINDRLRLSFSFNLTINDLQIDFTKINCKNFLVENRNGQISSLKLEGIIPKDTYCEFVSINTPTNINIDNLTNFGYIYFKDVTYSTPKFSNEQLGFWVIKNSDLGKTTFMGSDFSRLYLDFKSSKITESFLSDTIMPSEIKSHDGVNSSEQQRLGYGQLKKIYENRGDAVSALEYYAKEMNALEKSKKISLWEKINLFLGRISTNHGTNWARGLFSTMICTLLCFSLISLSSGISSSFTKVGWIFFCNNSIPAFLEFFNPLHKSKDIISILKSTKPELIKLTWAISVVDFLSKIFITYFEYQLIQAFRKHGKK